jgi:hypothetical protein
MTDITALEPEAAFDPVDEEGYYDPELENDTEPDPVDALVASLRELHEAGIEPVSENRPTPPPKRSPSSPIMPWEDYLAFLTQTPGKTVRLFKFQGPSTEARAKARRRASEVKNRLLKTNPQEIWDITWDFVKEDESWRVYVSYDRDRTETEMAELNAKHLAAQERGRHAAEVRKTQLDAVKG